MNKQESVLEKERHQMSWDFEVQINHLMPARRADLVIIKKKRKKRKKKGKMNMPYSVFYRCEGPLSENQRK